MIQNASQYPQYQFDKEKYPMGCEFDPATMVAGPQYPTDDRGNYTENEYAYVWENNATPPASVSSYKSRMQNAGQASDSRCGAATVSKEAAMYEPTTVKRSEHTVPQYYDIDPELAARLGGVAVYPPPQQQVPPREALETPERNLESISGPDPRSKPTR